MAAYNWVDYIILAIFFISIMAGLMRGVVKEILALLTWVAALAVAVMFSSKIAAMFTGSSTAQSIYSSSSTLSAGGQQPLSLITLSVVFVLLFVATFVIGSLITSIVSRAIESGGISFINRILGAAFGLLRGYLVVVLIIFVVGMTPFETQAWWTDAKLPPAFRPAVTWLANMVQPGLENLKSTVGQQIDSVKGMMQR